MLLRTGVYVDILENQQLEAAMITYIDKNGEEQTTLVNFLTD